MSFLGRTIMAGSILGFSLPSFLGRPDADHGFRRAISGYHAEHRSRGQTEILFGVPWSFLTLDGTCVT